MAYTMKAVFTITMAKISKETGETLRTDLLAKSVNENQACIVMENRTANNYHMKAVLGNMVESVKKHGESYAIFYYPTEGIFNNPEASFEFYVSAREQIA